MERRRRNRTLGLDLLLVTSCESGSTRRLLPQAEELQTLHLEQPADNNRSTPLLKEALKGFPPGGESFLAYSEAEVCNNWNTTRR
ncbi:MAG: hypothetical protein ACLS29_06805 [Prevotellamassilia sp.]